MVICKGGDGAGVGVDVGDGVGVVVRVAWTAAATVAGTSGVGSTVAVGANVDVGAMVAVGIAPTAALTATSMVCLILGATSEPLHADKAINKIRMPMLVPRCPRMLMLPRPVRVIREMSRTVIDQLDRLRAGHPAAMIQRSDRDLSIALGGRRLIHHGPIL